MKTEDFILRFIEKNGILRDNNFYLGLNWDQWKNLASICGKIEFNCGGNKEDSTKCSGAYSASNKGCCTECRLTMGYHSILPKNLMLLREIADRFDSKTGFWRAEPDPRTNKHCTLPYGWRSPICLGFYCKNDLSVVEDSFLDLITGKMPWNVFVVQTMSMHLRSKKNPNKKQSIISDENINRLTNTIEK